jgi:16S rRNA (guanine(966)-N(2))-methyltransferase RsmD
VRVIAGRLGGRELRAPKGRSTRPTTDRVREALFSVLGDISGARVLDLFAGSGALGIEALSRGAAHASFVESSESALATLRENLARLGLEGSAVVIRAPVERSRRALLAHGPFDLVFCDPPWAELSAALRSATKLLDATLLAPGATLVVEHPTREPVELVGRAGLRLESRRTWGDTSVSIYVAPGAP